jgi:hypothetical protein
MYLSNVANANASQKLSNGGGLFVDMVGAVTEKPRTSKLDEKLFVNGMYDVCDGHVRSNVDDPPDVDDRDLVANDPHSGDSTDIHNTEYNATDLVENDNYDLSDNNGSRGLAMYSGGIDLVDNINYAITNGENTGEDFEMYNGCKEVVDNHSYGNVVHKTGVAPVVTLSENYENVNVAFTGVVTHPEHYDNVDAARFAEKQLKIDSKSPPTSDSPKAINKTGTNTSHNIGPFGDEYAVAHKK